MKEIERWMQAGRHILYRETDGGILTGMGGRPAGRQGDVDVRETGREGRGGRQAEREGERMKTGRDGGGEKDRQRG